MSAKLRVAFVIVWLLALGFAAPARAQDAQATQELLAARGQYLVRVANCISCHTAKDGKPFAGGKAFQTTYRFLGAIYSSNITPDRETGLGGWTEDDFIRAMRFGIAPGEKHLFPAFPYPAFTKLNAGDLKAIYAYLRTLPAVHAVPPENSFWFRQRWVMVVWNALFLEPGELRPDPGQSAAWNRGHYLVEGLGHCGACHTPRNILLAERADDELTGGLQIGEVEVGKTRLWSAPNLTSAESALGKWTVEDLRKYLKTGSSRRAGAFGPMNEVIANSLRYLSEDDAAALASYIKGLPAAKESTEQILSVDERSAGQALYDKHCEECHLATGRGGFRKSPPVAGSAVVQSQDAASLLNAIVYGVKTVEDIPSAFDAWEDMPAFKDKMTDPEIAQLANFLRVSWGNRGGRVTRQSVAAQR